MRHDRATKIILIASTDRNTTEAFRQRFESIHVLLHCVQRGVDVIREVLDYNCSLLVLDMEFSGVLGIEVLPIVRRLRPRLPVILLTEDYTHQIRQMAAELGITYHTAKPTNLGDREAILLATEKILEKCHPLISS